MRAFLFPGQGSQTLGMGRSLFEQSAAARLVFEEVDAALAAPLSQLVFEGPADRLTLTENAQPALMAVSLAALRVLEERSGAGLEHHADFVAGHSLGEYSALAAAGALSLTDVARLLRLRGRAMQAAVPVDAGAMAAVLGLDIASVEAALEDMGGEGVCTIANDNGPGQVVISGDRETVAHAAAVLKAKGAKRSMLLDVSAPFHCALMAPAAEAMAEALRNLSFARLRVPVVTNVTAGPEADPARIKTLLVEQVTGRVRWRESVLALRALGVDTFVEIGAGKVLTGVNRRIAPEARSVSLQTPDDISAWLSTLASAA